MNPKACAGKPGRMPPHSLDIHDWRIVERAPGPPGHASVFAVGNGYLGVRGSPEEGQPRATPA